MTHGEGKGGSLREGDFREDTRVHVGGSPVTAGLGLRHQPGDGGEARSCEQRPREDGKAEATPKLLKIVRI